MIDRIAFDPAVLGGQPHIRGTRHSVQRIIEALMRHKSYEALLRDYPELEPEDVRAAADFAAVHFTLPAAS